MIRSMTAFASRSGSHGHAGWTWDLRGVNGRGLDLRLRLPDGIDGLEVEARKRLGAALSRGNVTLGLKLAREAGENDLSLDADHLARVLHALDEVQSRAVEMGVTLAQPTAADVLAQRGVLAHGPAETAPDPELARALLVDLDALIADFIAMRNSEGAALTALMRDQVSAIEALVDEAEARLPERGDQTRAALRRALDRITAENAPVEEDRLAQELALIAVKTDVTEELDRLRAHIATARDLLGQGGAVGRKLDFLAQEFNREANTLCSKAQDKELTRIGLDLKAVIDQMREQTQNVE
ncbi:MAG: YicC family protein [Alphaproteobacteria bacterium]|nr:YicC family protein [Alphaproteobacteria bacterium]